MITLFTGKYELFSNFAACNVKMDGVWYPSVEHAYQAAKSPYDYARTEIRNARGPGAAKRMGQSITLRADWEQVKVDIMRDLLVQKFMLEPFKRVLLSTGTEKIVEGNTWHDNIWGICFCNDCPKEGLNHLGRLLEEIRDAHRV